MALLGTDGCLAGVEVGFVGAWAVCRLLPGLSKPALLLVSWVPRTVQPQPGLFRPTSPLLQPGAFHLLSAPICRRSPPRCFNQVLFTSSLLLQTCRPCSQLKASRPAPSTLCSRLGPRFRYLHACKAPLNQARDVPCRYVSCPAGAQCVALLQVVPPRAIKQCIANFQICPATIPPLPSPSRSRLWCLTTPSPPGAPPSIAPWWCPHPATPGSTPAAIQTPAGEQQSAAAPCPAASGGVGLLRDGAADCLACSDALRAKLICLSCIAHRGALAVHTLPRAGLLWPVPPLLRPTSPCWVTPAAALRPRC